jgi:hypothetical protein
LQGKPTGDDDNSDRKDKKSDVTKGENFFPEVSISDNKSDLEKEKTPLSDIKNIEEKPQGPIVPLEDFFYDAPDLPTVQTFTRTFFGRKSLLSYHWLES